MREAAEDRASEKLLQLQADGWLELWIRDRIHKEENPGYADGREEHTHNVVRIPYPAFRRYTTGCMYDTRRSLKVSPFNYLSPQD